MTDIAGAAGFTPGRAQQTRRTQPTASTEATGVVHESYSFACMRCGHGWEQSYDIEHHTDGSGNEFVVYVADGERVPSPLTRPTCMNCGGHVVRILRPGRISGVQDIMRAQYAPKQTTHTQVTERQAAAAERPAPGPVTARQITAADAAAATSAAAGSTVAPAHRWHFSDLLRLFKRRGYR